MAPPRGKRFRAPQRPAAPGVPRAARAAGSRRWGQQAALRQARPPTWRPSPWQRRRAAVRMRAPLPRPFLRPFLNPPRPARARWRLAPRGGGAPRCGGRWHRPLAGEGGRGRERGRFCLPIGWRRARGERRERRRRRWRLPSGSALRAGGGPRPAGNEGSTRGNGGLRDNNSVFFLNK